MASLGRTVNTLAHLLLAIIASLSSPDTTATELVNVALRSVGSIAGHCGKVMGVVGPGAPSSLDSAVAFI